MHDMPVTVVEAGVKNDVVCEFVDAVVRRLRQLRRVRLLLIDSGYKQKVM